MTVKEWNILTVDDEPERQEDIKRVLGTRMDGNRFNFTLVNSFDEAIPKIETGRFDIVFLDVHDNSGDPDPTNSPAEEDQRGEEILQKIKNSLFVPVVFYTGYSQKVKHLASPFVKVVAKGSEVEDLRRAVKEILSTGLPELSKHIEEQSRTYMWNSLSKVLSETKIEVQPKDLSLLMARNLAKNLSQKVIKDIIGIDCSKINPLEMYLYPPDQTECNPADIFRKADGSHWMVLTTACDFEQRKAENVLMARVIPIKEHPLYGAWQKQNAIYKKLAPAMQQLKKSKTPLKVAMDDVRRLVKGQAGDRYKILPGTFFLPDCIVDFQDLANEPMSDSADYELVCSLDNPYREEMLQLFSKYYGRIGTPDYDIDVLWEQVDADFNEAH
ncbi:MAG: CheY-like chemotaxis protein [Candidatus Azotimanducaceae bacterium]|jgi:CheY-like chemotaxis protein